MEQKKRKSDFRLPSVDDLFTTQEMRDEEKMTIGKILEVPINEIDDFENHPFHVRDDAEMDALMESIKEHGVIEPATVRKKEDGRYEMVSGHRRKHASERLGLTTIRCEVVDISREEAILQMVESNLHREYILPSEKAFSYKMRLEAINKQAGRPSKENLTPVVSNFNKVRTNEQLGEEVGESREQIRRYIRLTELIPEILDMVDNSVIKDKSKLQMALRPAVEISYLDKNEQRALLEIMELNDCTPSHAQTLVMKNLSQEGNLTVDKMSEIMHADKPNQRVKYNISDKVMKLIPKNISDDADKINDYLEKAVHYYERFLERKKEHEAER